MKKTKMESPEGYFYRYLQELSLAKKKILVGFSGGVDSTVLLRLLHEKKDQLGFSLFVMHVDHGLRGNESTVDALHCRSVCEHLNLPFSLIKKEVRLLAQKEKSSIELAARRFRKKSYVECASRLGCDYVFLGHTLNDQVETLLFRLFRGTGLYGMTGMQETQRQGNLVWCRPCLSFKKEELLSLAVKKKWDWIEDTSNKSLEYTRNQIRLELIPVLEKVFSHSFPESLLRFGTLCGRARNALVSPISESVSGAFLMSGNTLKIDLKKIAFVPEVSFIELFRDYAILFNPEGYMPSFERCGALYELCFLETGKKIEIWPGVWAHKKRDFVLIEKKT